MTDRLRALKLLLEPSYSKFGFALSEKTSSNDELGMSSGPSTETGFVKEVRKLLERLLVFHAET